jgi:O-antigen ligase
MVHPYVFAGFALVAGFLFAAGYTKVPARILVAAAAVAIVPVGFTYSRAALLGFVVGLAVLASAVLVRDKRARFLPVVLALALGAAVPALIWSDGWVSRTSQAVTAKNAGSLSTDRGWLIHEANGLIVDHPVFGVGPGRYVVALKDKYGTEPNRSVGIFKPVHNLPLLLTAEGGIPAGLFMTALLILAGLRALSSGRPAVALFLAYLPFTQLDHFAYSFPQGLVITALWLGGIEVLAGLGRSDDLSELPLQVVDLVA